MRISRHSKMEKDDVLNKRQTMIDEFSKKCDKICRIEELTNIVLDMVYKQANISKNFAWVICGDQIIENLLKANNYTYYTPIQSDRGDFDYNGNTFEMVKGECKNETDDDT